MLPGALVGKEAMIPSNVSGKEFSDQVERSAMA